MPLHHLQLTKKVFYHVQYYHSACRNKKKQYDGLRLFISGAGGVGKSIISLIELNHFIIPGVFAALLCAPTGTAVKMSWVKQSIRC